MGGMRTVIAVLVIGLLLPLTSFGADGNASSGETSTSSYDPTDAWFGPTAEYEHQEESVLSRYPILMFLMLLGIVFGIIYLFGLLDQLRP